MGISQQPENSQDGGAQTRRQGVRHTRTIVWSASFLVTIALFVLIKQLRCVDGNVIPNPPHADLLKFRCITQHWNTWNNDWEIERIRIPGKMTLQEAESNALYMDLLGALYTELDETQTHLRVTTDAADSAFDQYDIELLSESPKDGTLFSVRAPSRKPQFTDLTGQACFISEDRWVLWKAERSLVTEFVRSAASPGECWTVHEHEMNRRNCGSSDRPGSVHSE